MTTPHPCPDWRELLSAYHDRQLSAAESRPVEDHLDECAACRATLAQWEADRARFTAAFADSTASAAMKKHILQELRNMESSSKEVSLPLGWLRWILGLSTAAVLACVLLFVAVLLMRPGAQVAFLPANQEVQVTDDQTGMPLEATTRYLDHKLLHGAREKVDYGYNGYLVPSAPNPVASPVEARRLKAANAYSAKNTFYNRAGDTFVNGPEAEKAYDAFTFTEPTRNYGIPGGIKLAYDADVCVQVADGAGAEGAAGGAR